jgi:hypothetical protein
MMDFLLSAGVSLALAVYSLASIAVAIFLGRLLPTLDWNQSSMYRPVDGRVRIIDPYEAAANRATGHALNAMSVASPGLVCVALGLFLALCGYVLGSVGIPSILLRVSNVSLGVAISLTAAGLAWAFVGMRLVALCVVLLQGALPLVVFCGVVIFCLMAAFNSTPSTGYGQWIDENACALKLANPVFGYIQGRTDLKCIASKRFNILPGKWAGAVLCGPSGRANWIPLKLEFSFDWRTQRQSLFGTMKWKTGDAGFSSVFKTEDAVYSVIEFPAAIRSTQSSEVAWFKGKFEAGAAAWILTGDVADRECSAFRLMKVAEALPH